MPVVAEADVYLTTEGAGAYLKLAPQTLEAARHKADGSGPPYIKLPRAVRYRRSQLDAWMAKHDHPPDRPTSRKSQADAGEVHNRSENLIADAKRPRMTRRVADGKRSRSTALPALPEYDSGGADRAATVVFQKPTPTATASLSDDGGGFNADPVS